MSALLKLFIRLILMLGSLVVWICVKLRLGIPLLYTVLMCTVFLDWASANETLSVGILVALLGGVAISWIYTAVRAIKRRVGGRSSEDLQARMVADQLIAAKEQGIDALHFTRDGSAIDE